MSALVDVLEDEEQQQIANKIGGVLIGIRTRPYMIISEQQRDAINTPSSVMDLGSSSGSLPNEKTICHVPTLFFRALMISYSLWRDPGLSDAFVFKFKSSTVS